MPKIWPSFKQMASFCSSCIENESYMFTTFEKGIIKSVLQRQKKREALFPAQIDWLIRIYEKSLIGEKEKEHA